MVVCQSLSNEYKTSDTLPVFHLSFISLSPQLTILSSPSFFHDFNTSPHLITLPYVTLPYIILFYLAELYHTYTSFCISLPHLIFTYLTIYYHTIPY